MFERILMPLDGLLTSLNPSRELRSFWISEYLLKVAEFHPKPGSQDEMYYIDDKGELFIGPAKNVTIGKSYQVRSLCKARWWVLSSNNLLGSIQKQP